MHFKRPAGTSRGVLHDKPVWYIVLEEGDKKGIGECNPLVGLSLDDRPDFEDILQNFVRLFAQNQHIDLRLLEEYPAMKFGFEMALHDFNTPGRCMFFPSEFTRGNAVIPINGLVWMGKSDFMFEQLEEKLDAGFNCIKMKIGAIDFISELDILKSIRSRFTPEQIELRVDANGAFLPGDALEKLKRLSEFQIHSIEQPIKQGQWDEMATLCRVSPLPIALDEELIAIRNMELRLKMLQTIHPDYIILKPSLLGGFSDTNQWIDLAKSLNINWWITSALESNIGLNAIAQFTFIKNNPLPQGLGTGSLYTNNIISPLCVNKGNLLVDKIQDWNLSPI